MDARLVVLGADHAHSKEPASKALEAAKMILETRGNAPRLFRNTLVFLAVDQTRLQDLDEAVRRYLAWESILLETEALNLDPQQVKQAETQKKSADGAVTARLPETYQWLLVPVQPSPQAAVEWQAYRLTGQDALAVRASKRLRNEELLVPVLAGTRLRMELDRVPLWRGDHVPIKQLAEDFGRYLYLPRLKDSQVLAEAVQDGLALLLWNQESFAYADSYDEAAGRYRGLRAGKQISVSLDQGEALLVRSDVALKQLSAEAPSNPTAGEPGQARPIQPGMTDGGASDGVGTSPVSARVPKRFHGTVPLDPTRVGRDAGRIADEVISHLVGLVGSEVTVTLEIEAAIPGGAPDNVVRTVTENSRTLKFASQGFEEE
jgi:hypothetical protein